MRAFWWFEDRKIAGFARPGFNCTHWFDFPFDEGIIMSWLGQFNTGLHPYSDLKRHLITYTPKVAPFYNINKSIDENTDLSRFSPESLVRLLVLLLAVFIANFQVE